MGRHHRLTQSLRRHRQVRQRRPRRRNRRRTTCRFFPSPRSFPSIGEKLIGGKVSCLVKPRVPCWSSQEFPAGQAESSLLYRPLDVVVLGIGGASRDRTDDLIVANDALSQLSYSPTELRAGEGLPA